VTKPTSRNHRGACTYAIATVAAFAALVGLGCHPNGSVKFWVFNQTHSLLKVADEAIEYWSSHQFYVDPGDSLALPITSDGRDRGTLVVVSLVAAGDPGRYGAVANIRQDTLGLLYAEEYSPWLDARVVDP